MPNACASFSRKQCCWGDHAQRTEAFIESVIAVAQVVVAGNRTVEIRRTAAKALPRLQKAETQVGAVAALVPIAEVRGVSREKNLRTLLRS